MVPRHLPDRVMTVRSSRDVAGAFRRTMRFVFAQWRRQPLMALAIAAGVTLLTVAEVVAPLLAGRLIDVVADKLADRALSLDTALTVFAAMAGLGVVVVVLRFVVFLGVVRFT